MNMQRTTAPDAWIAEIFAAKAATTGGVIRRNRRWVEAEIGWDRFVGEVQARGFHLLGTGHQLIVVCHRGHIHMHF